MQYNISPDDYFGNYLQSVKQSFMDELRSLRQPVDKSVWLTPPTAVNAYYDPQFNEFGEPVALYHVVLINNYLNTLLVFLEGILNVPFFDAGWPE